VLFHVIAETSSAIGDRGLTKALWILFLVVLPIITVIV